MIAGIVLLLIGLIGSKTVFSFMERDYFYTYNSPFTGHEVFVLMILFSFVIMLLIGVLIIIFSIVKKKNSDMLRQLENMQQDGQILGICPKCGLNVSKKTKICPKCGTEIEQKEE